MATNLVRLPLELLVSIASHLNTVEYGNLRRSCKAIERAVFHFWATEFFTVRQICLFMPSLQNLVEISNHAELNQYVKKVLIGLDKFTSPFPMPGRPRHDLLAAYDKYEDMITNQTWKVPLATALKAFPSRQCIQFRDFLSEHLRPREHTPWRGYGIKTAQQDLGYAFSFGGLMDGGVFMSRFVDLCAQQGIELLSLENICRQSPTILGSLRIGNADMPRYVACMQHLTTFFVTLVDAPMPVGWPAQHELASFCRFLDCMPSLRHLRVNISFYHGLPDNPANSEVIECAQTTTDRILKEFTWSELQLNKLDIGMAHLHKTLLSGVCASSKTCLEHLNLHRIIALSPEAWHALLEQIGELSALKSLIVNNSREQNFIGWTASADVKPQISFRPIQRTTFVWPVQNRIHLTGNNGAELSQAAASRIVFPGEVLETSRAEDIAMQRACRFRFATEEPPKELAEDADEGAGERFYTDDEYYDFDDEPDEHSEVYIHPNDLDEVMMNMMERGDSEDSDVSSGSE